MGKPLTPTERNILKDEILTFQIPDAANVFFDCVNDVAAEVKERRDKAKEEADSFRDLLIDSLVCFVPYGAFIKKIVPKSAASFINQKLGEEDFAQSAIADSSKDLIKSIVTEKMFSDQEEADWDQIKNYAQEMKQGMRKRLYLTYKFLVANINDTSKLPDRLLVSLNYKYHIENFTFPRVKSMIREQLKAFDYFYLLPWKGQQRILGEGMNIKLANYTDVSRITGEFILHLIEVPGANDGSSNKIFLPVMEFRYYDTNPHGRSGARYYQSDFNVVPPSLVEGVSKKAWAGGFLKESTLDQLPDSAKLKLDDYKYSYVKRASVQNSFWVYPNYKLFR